MSGELNCHFNVSGMWIAPLIRIGNKYLMDEFLTLGLSDKHMKELNYCRLYLYVYTLADIVNAEGTTIMDRDLQGKWVMTSEFHWPYQE